MCLIPCLVDEINVMIGDFFDAQRVSLRNFFSFSELISTGLHNRFL